MQTLCTLMVGLQPQGLGHALSVVHLGSLHNAPTIEGKNFKT